MENDNNNLTIEESFNRLDQIIAKMQSVDLSLEETFALYKDGLSLVDSCNSKIQKIQCDIQKLSAVEE